jgi:hypothetical protein
MGKESTMHHSTLSEVIKLPGVSDLPVQVKWHFAHALIAEMEGNIARAESELTLAVEAEDAFSTPAPAA